MAFFDINYDSLERSLSQREIPGSTVSLRIRLSPGGMNGVVESCRCLAKTELFSDHFFVFHLFFCLALFDFPTASTISFILTLRGGHPSAGLIGFIQSRTSPIMDCVILKVFVSVVFTSDLCSRKSTTDKLLTGHFMILIASLRARSKLQ